MLMVQSPDMVADVLNRMYPVGSVYLSVLPANPSDQFGFGVWTAFAAGRALVGVDPADIDFDTAEKTVGAKTATPAGTVSQPTFTGVPITDVINHTHPVNVSDRGHSHVQGVNSTATGGLSGYTADTSTNSRVNSGYSTSPATTGITATTSNPAGGVASITPAGTVTQPTFIGNEHSVQQKSIAVYAWKRTA